MGSATTNNFDVKNFLNKWGKCLEDINGCNRALATGGGSTSAMAKISSAASKDNSLSDCLSSIQSLTQFLSNQDDSVKKHAASTIANLALKAATFLQKETDPSVIKKTADFLSSVVEKVNAAVGSIQSNGTVSVDPSVKKALDQVTQLVDKKLRNSADKDQFVRYSKDDFADVTEKGLGKMPKEFDKGKFVDSVNSARHNLIGDTNYTKFVTSTGKAMKTIIGDIPGVK